MVAERDLDAEAFGHEEEVVCHGVGKRRCRIAVVRCVHPRAHAFGLERANLGKQVRDRTPRVVRARDAHNARRAAGDEFGEHEFGRARSRTAFTAAARDVDVLVEEARREDFACGVDRFEIIKIGREIVADGFNAVVHKKNVLAAERFGREDGRVLDENGGHENLL